MWNVYIITGNATFNIPISDCFDFNPKWNSVDAYNYVLDKLENNEPFTTPDEVVYIKDKKAIKNIRVHRVKSNVILP